MPAQRGKDHYKTLEVPRDVDQETLKKTYRRLAKEYHPDRHSGDVGAEERFKQLQEAYAVLKDPGKRDEYDAACRSARGTAGGTKRKGRPGGASSAAGDHQGASGMMEDIFEFVRSRMEHRPKRGEDLRYMLTLPFEEAAAGAKKVIHIPKLRTCSRCDGRGWTVQGKSPICGTCRGEGEITVTSGNKQQLIECPGCAGQGVLDKIPCKRCKGEGETTYRIQRTVSIPPGVDNGTRLKLRGEGSAGEKGGEKGDLYIVIQVEEHPVFTRQNQDIWCNVPIHFTQAVLGDDIRVPTLTGEIVQTIPPGTQHGEVFTVEKIGIPDLNGAGAGDQKIRILVEVPRDVTEEEKELLRTWQDMRQGGL